MRILFVLILLFVGVSSAQAETSEDEREQQVSKMLADEKEKFWQELKVKGPIDLAIDNALGGDYGPVGFYHYFFELYPVALDCSEEYLNMLGDLLKEGKGRAFLRPPTYSEQTTQVMLYNWTLYLMPDYPYTSSCKIRPMPSSEEDVALTAWKMGLKPDEFKKTYAVINQIEGHILKRLNMTKEEYEAKRKSHDGSLHEKKDDLTK